MQGGKLVFIVRTAFYKAGIKSENSCNYSDHHNETKHTSIEQGILLLLYQALESPYLDSHSASTSLLPLASYLSFVSSLLIYQMGTVLHTLRACFENQREVMSRPRLQVGPWERQAAAFVVISILTHLHNTSDTQDKRRRPQES